MFQSQQPDKDNAVEPSGDTNLSSLAEDIDKAHSVVQSAFNDALQHAVECGQLLSKAKQAVPHGEWEDWITANTSLSARTARAYMQAAEYWARADDEKRQRVADLSFRQALAKISKPRIGNRTAGSSGAIKSASGTALASEENGLASLEGAATDDKTVRRLGSSASDDEYSLFAHTIMTLSSLAGRLDPGEASTFLLDTAKHRSVGGTVVNSPTASDIEQCLSFLGDLRVERSAPE